MQCNAEIVIPTTARQVARKFATVLQQVRFWTTFQSISMTSSDVFVSSPADFAGTAGSLAEGLLLSVSDALFRETFETSGLDDFCVVNDGELLATVGVDVTGGFSPVVVAGVVTPGVEVPVVGKG